MGYESRIYVVVPYRQIYPDGTKLIWAEKIATMDLGKMGYEDGWFALFQKDIEYKLFAEDGDTEFDTDFYGDHLRSCPIDKVIEWLEKVMEHNDYRRLRPLYGLLKGFDLDQWKEKPEVVHFGY